MNKTVEQTAVPLLELVGASKRFVKPIDTAARIANVFGAHAKEEVVLNFGMNASWDRASPEMEIELAHRLVMSPFAAQRLAEVLTKLMADYRSRYGELK